MDRREQVFLAALTEANQEVGRYVLRMLDESTSLGVTDYTRPLSDLEQTLGTSLLDLGRQLIERSNEREIPVVEGALSRSEISGHPLVVTAPRLPEVPS